MMRVCHAGAALVCCLIIVGCGDESPAECNDKDGDGFGNGCSLGPDCIDTDVFTHECVTPVDCPERPFQTGCPCLPGASASCYDGAEGTAGVGPCREGSLSCADGRWGPCTGAVLPSQEQCNGTDDDCDGLVDEAATSPCGGCNPQCVGGVWGTDGEAFTDSADLSVTSKGYLVLKKAAAPGQSVWIVNSGEATVSRVSTQSGMEIARYTSGGDESRVAVDYAGDAWIGSHRPDGQPTLTKIAGDITHCIDRDNDGLETSTGPSDVKPDGADECVLFTVPLSEAPERAWALSIDGVRGDSEPRGGDAWVGLTTSQQVLHIDGVTGEILARVPVMGMTPFGSTLDAWGTLWVASRDGRLASIDTGSEAPSAALIEAPLTCFLFHGITSDDDGRVLLTGFSCDQVILYDPEERTWRVVSVPQSPRGIAYHSPYAWIAHTDGRMSQLTVSPLRLVRTIDLTTEGFSPLESIGISTDDLGSVWVASRHTGDSSLGLLTRVNAETSTVSSQVSLGQTPHTLGDLTGGERRGGFVPQGTTSHVFGGCSLQETNWERVHIDAQVGPDAEVEIAVRHAANLASLSASTFQNVAILPEEPPPFDLDLPAGGVIELRLTLRTSRWDASPRIRRVGVEWSCPGVAG